MINFDWDVIQRSWVYLFQVGMTFTLELTFLSMAGGIVVGTLLAMMRLSHNKIVSTIATKYVNLIRSIPLVLVIFWFYFLVPFIGAWIIGASEPVHVGAFTSSALSGALPVRTEMLPLLCGKLERPSSRAWKPLNTVTCCLNGSIGFSSTGMS